MNVAQLKFLEICIYCRQIQRSNRVLLLDLVHVFQICFSLAQQVCGSGHIVPCLRSRNNAVFSDQVVIVYIRHSLVHANDCQSCLAVVLLCAQRIQSGDDRRFVDFLRYCFQINRQFDFRIRAVTDAVEIVQIDLAVRTVSQLDFTAEFSDQFVADSLHCGVPVFCVVIIIRRCYSNLSQLYSLVIACLHIMHSQKIV